jgi:outer membrane protein OmpA-like peptidoglycan-associated protein
MKQEISIATFFIGLAAVAFTGCQAGGEFAGREYIPDMTHSVAYEANVHTYNSYNTWGTEEEKRAMENLRYQVKGTVPRGYTSFSNMGGDDAATVLKAMRMSGGLPNGFVPYYFPNSDSGRLMAERADMKNPFVATKAGMEHGKEVYNIYCGVCHGEKGDGNGVLWNNGEGAYPNKPANFLDSLIFSMNDSRYYFTIMHGRNVMGGYSDKLSYEERWQVIHYIRSLQAKAKGKEYPVMDDEGFAASSGALAPKGVDFDLASAVKMVESNAAASPFVLNDLKFATGSAVIDVAASKDLNDLVSFLQKEKVNIEINGHTDNVGKADANLKLSDARAKAVADYLVKSGIDAARLKSKGNGDKMPVASNDDEAGRAKNRRTDFIILK